MKERTLLLLLEAVIEEMGPHFVVDTLAGLLIMQAARIRMQHGEHNPIADKWAKAGAHVAGIVPEIQKIGW